jgi:myo-inositol-1-phosphate synthase
VADRRARLDLDVRRLRSRRAAPGPARAHGIATERGPFRALGLRAFEDIVLGGHEISQVDLSRSAGELVRHGVLTQDLVTAASAEAAAYDARIRPGVLDVADVGRADLDPRSASLGGASPRERTDRLAEDLRAFRDEHELERVVVCNVASVEPWMDERPHWTDLERFERGLDGEGDFPASSLYAYAAFRAGAPFVNFTPNRGSSLPALRQLAVQLGLPHCGNDGKTGETLLKTALAPMFAARALKVLSWQGYNLLGNKDGLALADPVRARSKLANKDLPCARSSTTTGSTAASRSTTCPRSMTGRRPGTSCTSRASWACA